MVGKLADASMQHPAAEIGATCCTSATPKRTETVTTSLTDMELGILLDRQFLGISLALGGPPSPVASIIKQSWCRTLTFCARVFTDSPGLARAQWLFGGAPFLRTRMSCRRPRYPLAVFRSRPLR